MRAAIAYEYGAPEVLQIVNLPVPEPGKGEVLVKVHASTVTMGDCEIRGLFLPLWSRIPMRLVKGYRKPGRLIPGMEFSGVVEAVGAGVADLKVGDEVFGGGGINMSGNAEYICRKASALVRKPPEISHEQAATIIVGAINAYHFLSKVDILPGHKVLIIGGGGSIGTYAVQLAKNAGAEVTAVDQAEKLPVLKSLGADTVIDYLNEDFLSMEEQYDVIFDVVYQTPFQQCLDRVKEGGVYLMANPDPWRMIKGAWITKFSGKRVVSAFAEETPDDMRLLANMLAEGRITAYIDRRYTLENIVEAHRYVESGLKTGSVIIHSSDS